MKTSGKTSLGRDKRKPVTAHLSPRSKLDVSWLDNADSAAGSAAVLDCAR